MVQAFFLLGIFVLKVSFLQVQSGCKDGYFGENCKNICADNCQRCVARTEHLSESSCTECKKGYFRFRDGCLMCLGKCTACQGMFNCTKCQPGYYGSTCSKLCPKNCLKCLTGDKCTKCKDGWWSTVNKCLCSNNCFRDDGPSIDCLANGTCTKGCIRGKFGHSCIADCPEKDRCLECDQASGLCKLCVSGFYDAISLCDKKCGNCMPSISNEVTCSIYDGKCHGPCADGFYGKYCNMHCNENCKRCSNITGECFACKVGFYGLHCSNKCSRNCEAGFNKTGNEEDKENGPCDQNTGHCDLGCMPGWHNSSCQETCNVACTDRLCHIHTAECLNGCEHGFEGVFCDCKQCNDAGSRLSKNDGTIWTLTALLTVVTVAFLASVVGLVCLYRRRKNAKKTQEPAVYYNTSEPRSGAEKSTLPLNIPQQDVAYQDLQNNIMTCANYSQLGSREDDNVYTESA